MDLTAFSSLRALETYFDFRNSSFEFPRRGRYSAAATGAAGAAVAFLAGALAFGAAAGFALTAGFFEASLRAKYAARRFRLITLLYCLPIEGD